jgi:hypothetical protein
VVGETSSLGPDWVFGYLNQDRLAGLKDLLDLAILPLGTEVVPINLSGIDHTIAAPADVDEGRLH